MSALSAYPLQPSMVDAHDAGRSVSISSLLRWGLLLLTVMFPLQFVGRDLLGLPPAIVLASDVLILGLLALRVLELTISGGRLRLSIEAPLLALGAVAALSALVNRAGNADAVATLRLLFISPAMAILVVNLNAGPHYWRLVWRTVLITLLAQALWVAGQSFQVGFGQGLDAGSGLYGARAANSLGDVMLLGIVVQLQRAHMVGLPLRRFATILVLVVGMLLTSSRLALLILSIVVGLYLWEQHWSRVRRMAVLSALAAIVVGLAYTYYSTVTSGTSSGISLLDLRREVAVATVVGYGSAGAPRLLLVKWTWENVQRAATTSAPVWLALGLGPGRFGSFASYASDTPYHRLIAAQFEEWKVYSSPGLYSGYLSLFAEMGLLGLAAVAWLLTRAGVACWRARRDVVDPFWQSLAVGGLVAVIVLVLRGVLTNVLEDRIVSFYGWLLVGLATRAARSAVCQRSEGD